jgi:hypothetical protein
MRTMKRKYSGRKRRKRHLLKLTLLRSAGRKRKEGGRKKRRGRKGRMRFLERLRQEKLLRRKDRERLERQVRLKQRSKPKGRRRRLSFKMKSLENTHQRRLILKSILSK